MNDMPDRRVDPDSYDRDRPLDHQPFWSACYAPFGTMYLDQRGQARACCFQPMTVLGDIREETIGEIWNGEGMRELRTALINGDLSRGCEMCHWRVADGQPELAYSRNFDSLRAGPDSSRPNLKMLELSLSNTCNLECAMCNGALSSRIRARREHLPPLHEPYGDQFFETLERLAPQLDEVRVLGGEPFLGRAPLRALSILARADPQPRVTITTNGTIWNDRVAGLVQTLRPGVVVSIDGATEGTYNTIRKGGSLRRVLANIRRFEAAGAEVSLTFCLMTWNWKELINIFEFGERNGLFVGVNTVQYPESASLFQLPVHQLQEVVTALEGTRSEARSRLRTSLGDYEAQISGLQSHLESRLSDEGAVQLPNEYELLLTQITAQSVRRAPKAAVERSLSELSSWSADEPLRIWLSREGAHTDVQGSLWKVPVQSLAGQPGAALLDILEDKSHQPRQVVVREQDHDYFDLTVTLTSGGVPTTVRIVSVAQRGPDGALEGIEQWVARRASPSNETPVEVRGPAL